jgi:beta-mannosidase
LQVLGVKKTDAGSFPSRYTSVFDVTITTKKPAAFVWLDAGEIKGRFSDNGFIFAQEERTVQFMALQDLSADELENALTIHSLNDALKF